VLALPARNADWDSAAPSAPDQRFFIRDEVNLPGLGLTNRFPPLSFSLPEMKSRKAKDETEQVSNKRVTSRAVVEIYLNPLSPVWSWPVKIQKRSWIADCV